MTSGVLDLSCQFTQAEHNILIPQQLVRNRTLVQRRESFLAAEEHSSCLFAFSLLSDCSRPRALKIANRYMQKFNHRVSVIASLSIFCSQIYQML